MPDIALRFHKDMLVLSSPLAPMLARQGFDVEQGLEFAGIVEPEAVREALRMNVVAGVQCVVANTANMTPARLAVRGMEDRVADIVGAAFSTLKQLAPQHVLIEVAPCGLPLDAASKNSLNEHRDQYARVARAFEGRPFDAFFLNGFQNPTDLKCALMGIRQISDAPVFASVDVDAEGALADGRYTFEDALAVMMEYGASVVGFATAAPLDRAVVFARRATGIGDLPVLAQLVVKNRDAKQGEAAPENPYYCPDVLVEAGVQLRQAGAQFLRATGQATPAFAGALVAASEGFDVARHFEVS
ncbi:homocysteine S-methyltransferase family protein [Eggerthella sp. YY7918]|uniref:homocysteine S-methyltransferase family protein n=1 Tax=Eggerthella sp. (strain YY7918) TaxID=502558 RepID=UPI00021711AA|nr:homocysteine S-methyltransferase family protein [Eggerthella sp. YY7918]BAK45787.1 methionine synthase I [Eggerthella sp. YY7918]